MVGQRAGALVSMIVAATLTGCPAPRVASIDRGPDPMTLVSQDRHAGWVTTVLGFPDKKGDGWLVTADGADVRAWYAARYGDERPVLREVWDHANYVWHPGTEWGERPWLLLTGSSKPRLMWVGEWIDLLPSEASRMTRIDEIRYFTEKSAADLGLALKETLATGDARWTLLYSKDSKSWGPAILDGLPDPIDSFVSLGGKSIAVRGRLRDGTPGDWVVAARNGDRWVANAMPGAPARVAQVTSIDWDGAFAMREKAGTTGPGAFYVATDSGNWAPLSSAVPGAPKVVHAVQTYGHRVVLAVQEEGDANGDGDAFTWSYFMRPPTGSWRPLVDALGLQRDATILAVRSFLKDSGIGVRVTHGSEDRWYDFVNQGDGWRPIDSVLKGASAVPWDVASFSDDRGVGVQSGAHADASEKPYVWQWFGRQGGNAWVLLDDILGVHVEAARVTGDLRQLVGLQDAEAKWQWYVQDQRSWKPLATALPAAHPGPGSSDVTSTADDRILSVSDERGHTEWFASGAGGWQDLNPFIERPGPASQLGSTVLAPVTDVRHPVQNDVVSFARLNDAKDAPRDVLLRGRNGEWSPWEVLVPAIPAPLEGVSGDHAFIRVLPKEENDPAPAIVRSPSGDWEPWRSPDGSPVRDGYSFLGGGEGVAIRHDRLTSSGAWSFWHRNNNGWEPLSALLPALPRRLRAVSSLESEQALLAYEDGDSDDNGVNDECIAYVKTRGGWRRASLFLPDAPRSIWQAASFAAGRGLSLQDRQAGEASKQGGAWHHYMRLEGDAFVPLATALPDLPADIEPPHSFAEGDGVLVQERRSGDWAASHLYLHTDSGSWQKLSFPGLPARVLSVEWLPRMRVLFVQLPEALKGGLPGEWIAFRESNDRGWTSITSSLTSGDAHISDVAVFDQGQRLAVDAFRGDTAERNYAWRWFEPLPSGQLRAAGTTDDPIWPGLGWSGEPAWRIRFAGAVHVIDGAPTDGVPKPTLWFAASATSASGRVLLAPKLVPTGIDVAATGAGGTLLLYRAADKWIAASFSKGAVTLDVIKTVSGTSVPVILDRLDSGIVRVHRFDDPSRFVSRYDAPGGSVWFDDRGFFYSDGSEPPAELRVVGNGLVYPLSFLKGYVFRPDMIERRLGLGVGALFNPSPDARRWADESRMQAPRGIRWARAAR